MATVWWPLSGPVHRPLLMTEAVFIRGQLTILVPGTGVNIISGDRS